ncbi:uncharacterized protein FIBRA_07270 [Fibroporia radiculosa]|uniref:Ketoreductase (KR) domain-containing protein n=1 Tax=Fibroporia radiculosa TaxID=599839 RepID=J4H4I7_9APHY|nr:uncharacterized protein FIBRA_07270 [Fibroporia radiculosa]CCM05064.1 predicted protein [Fibroporia radiculosa]
MTSYLVTGASRGIGLAMVEKLLQNPSNFVIAAARHPNRSEDLQSLRTKYGDERLTTLILDYADPASTTAAAERASMLLPNGLDYLVSNAGVALQSGETFDTIDLEVFEEELRINTIAPVRVVRAFLPLVRKGKGRKVVFITSRLGSLELAPNFGALSVTYSTTKAALNFIARRWAPVLKQEGIATVLIHPGWVETDMGDELTDWMKDHLPERRKISVDQSATDCLKVIQDSKCENAIKLYSHDGTTVPL